MSTPAPKFIRIADVNLFAQRGASVPGHVLGQPRLTFKPQDFAIGGADTYLKQRIIDSQFQTLGLEAFLDAPHLPCLYAVGSEPDDSAAKLFAAFLMQEYLLKVNNTLAVWHGLHEQQMMVRQDAPCSFLVITGLTPESTPYRLEKARDLIEHYHRIPKVVVIGGMDPITFFYTKLRLKPTQFFYVGKGINRKVEIV